MARIPEKVMLFADNAWWRKAVVAARSPEMKRWVYEQYLFSQAWQKKRQEQFEKSQRCEVCHFGEATEVHHKTYANLGDEQDGDLMSLCDDCHRAEHGRLPKFVDQVCGTAPMYRHGKQVRP